MLFKVSKIGDRFGSEVSILTPNVNERFKGKSVNLVVSLILEQTNLGEDKLFG